MEKLIKKLRNQLTYDDGFVDGVTCFAWWKDGEEYVGTTGHKLKTELADREHLSYYRKEPSYIEEAIEAIEELQTEVTDLRQELHDYKTAAEVEADCADEARKEVAELSKQLAEWTDYFECDSPHDTFVGQTSLLGKEQARANLAENRIVELENAIKNIELTLTVPAAEYVPAIGDVFKIIADLKIKP